MEDVIGTRKVRAGTLVANAKGTRYHETVHSAGVHFVEDGTHFV
jgi:hypothetical protein